MHKCRAATSKLLGEAGHFAYAAARVHASVGCDVAVKMNILKSSTWQRRKIGTAVFNEQHNFSLAPTGEATKTYTLQELQSVQWEPNGFTDHVLRNPFGTFVAAFLIFLLLDIVLFAVARRGFSLGFLLGFAAMYAAGSAFGKSHRARFQFADGNSALLGISTGFARKLRSLKPGIGP